MKTAKRSLAFFLALILAAACSGVCFSAAAPAEYEDGDEYTLCPVSPEGTGRVYVRKIPQPYGDPYCYLQAEPNEGFMFAGWYLDGHLMGRHDDFPVNVEWLGTFDYTVRFMPEYKVGDRFYIPKEYDPGETGYAIVTDIGYRNGSYGPYLAYTVEAVANEGYRFLGWFHYHKEELMVESTGVILSEEQLFDLHPKFEKTPTGFAAFWEKVVELFRNIFNWLNGVFNR